MNNRKNTIAPMQFFVSARFFHFTCYIGYKASDFMDESFFCMEVNPIQIFNF